MIISRSIHVAANGIISFFFVANIPVYICTMSSLSGHLSVDIYVAMEFYLLIAQLLGDLKLGPGLRGLPSCVWQGCVGRSAGVYRHSQDIRPWS